jgi:hypothetical protein
MAASSCVVLYGNSVFLAGIQADLQRRAELAVLTVEPDCPDTAARICALNPTAVLFDLAAAQPDFAIPLLRAWPDMLLIGVNSSSEEILVLSGQQVRAASMTELTHVITGDSAGG